MTAARLRVAAVDIPFTFAEHGLCIIGQPVDTMER
jgi:hypothetical protein